MIAAPPAQSPDCRPTQSPQLQANTIDRLIAAIALTAGPAQEREGRSSGLASQDWPAKVSRGVNIGLICTGWGTFRWWVDGLAGRRWLLSPREAGCAEAADAADAAGGGGGGEACGEGLELAVLAPLAEPPLRLAVLLPPSPLPLLGRLCLRLRSLPPRPRRSAGARRLGWPLGRSVVHDSRHTVCGGRAGLLGRGGLVGRPGRGRWLRRGGRGRG